MQNRSLIAAAALLLCGTAAIANKTATGAGNSLPWPVTAASDLPREQLEERFASPATQSTACYYYILNGHLSPEGVAADFRSMKEAGINRAFIGYHGVDGLTHGPVMLHDSVWYDSFRTAMRTAQELSLIHI